MSWQKEHMDELDELTIENLPEPYKTWCEDGEKPFPWYKVAERWVIWKGLKKLEQWFPKRFGSRVISETPGKFDRWHPGISHGWYPYGSMFFTSDVPDDILFPAMHEAETDFTASRIDSAMMRRKYEGER